MTPICSEHAMLLRALAHNTNDKTALKAYADWLMERGNPGWLIVLSYKVHDWFVFEIRKSQQDWNIFYWRLPWLNGVVKRSDTTHHLQRIKYILNCYADGKVIE